MFNNSCYYVEYLSTEILQSTLFNFTLTCRISLRKYCGIIVYILHHFIFFTFVHLWIVNIDFFEKHL